MFPVLCIICNCCTPKMHKNLASAIHFVKTLERPVAAHIFICDFEFWYFLVINSFRKNCRETSGGAHLDLFVIIFEYGAVGDAYITRVISFIKLREQKQLKNRLKKKQAKNGDDEARERQMAAVMEICNWHLAGMLLSNIITLINHLHLAHIIPKASPLINNHNSDGWRLWWRFAIDIWLAWLLLM